MDDNGCTNRGRGSAIVTVNPPATVTVNPTNKAVCAGSSVSFTASGGGSPATSVQWQKSGDGGNTFTNVPGATNSTLTFTTSLNDNGSQYLAVLSNSCGVANSSAATLTVNALPICSISGPNGLCAGSSNNVYSAPAGLIRYLWAISGNGTLAGQTTNQTVTVTAGTTNTFTLTLTLTNASGCGSSCSLLATNHPKPTATVSGGGTICLGTFTNIQAVLAGVAPW